MANANRFTQFKPQGYVSDYVEMPFQEIAQVGAMRQQRQDIALEELSRINAGVKGIHALPKSQEYAQNAVKEITGNIDQFTSMDFNDPSVRANWNKTKAGIAQRFMPTGDLGMIDNNYKLGMEWSNEFKKSGQDAGWGTNQLSGYANSYLGNWEDIDPETGQLRMFQGEGVANRVDYNDWLSKSLKDVAYNSSSLGLSQAYSGNALYNAWMTGTVDKLDKQKIIDALSKRAVGDAILHDSLEQEGKFHGQEGWSNFISGSYIDPKTKQEHIVLNTENPFGLMLTGVAEGAQFRREDTDYQIKEDPYEAQKAKNKADQETTTVPFKLPGSLPANLTQEEIEIANNPLDVTTFGLNIGWAAIQASFGDYGGAGKTMAKAEQNIKIAIQGQPALTADQNKIVEKASIAYGQTIPSDNKGKAELYNKYINDMNNREINIGYNQYTNPKQIETLNKVYFSPDQKGAANAAYSEFTLISGEGKAKGSGEETVFEEYGDTEKYNITVAGGLNPDNPYYATGQIVQVLDKKSGQLIATYAMETPLTDDQDQQSAEQIHDISKAKYSANQESKVETTKGTYNIEYIPIYHPTQLNNDGSPILIGEKLEVTNPKGEEVNIDPQYGDIWQQSLEFIQNDSQQ